MKIIQKTSSYRFHLMTKVYDNWLKKNEKALDVGCGIGTITKLLRDRYSLQIKACDIKNYLDDPNITFLEIHKGKLPKFKNKFDVAFLNDVLHHIPKKDQGELIKQALQIANKVIIFEMKPTYLAKIFDTILNKVHYENLFIPLAFRNIAEWQTLFKTLHAKSKFKILNRPFWYPFNHIAFLVQKA